MRHFGYTHTISGHSVVFVPPTLKRRQIDDIFDDYESHLVPDEAWSILVVSNWSYVEGHIKWFFRVSYSYMAHVLIETHLGQLIRRY